MVDLSNNSFIPKRGPVKHSRASSSRQVYIFTYISYVIIFATLLAAGGVFLYGKYYDKKLESEVSALNAEINSFSEADMQKVLEFDRRLGQADDRLRNSVSLVSVFSALEEATIDSVRLNSLNLQREEDESFAMTATVETDSFDSAIFQRGVYQRNQTVGNVKVADVITTSKQSEQGEENSTEPVIQFMANFQVSLSAVPYVGSELAPEAPITITKPALEELGSSSDGANTEFNNVASSTENI